MEVTKLELGQLRSRIIESKQVNLNAFLKILVQFQQNCVTYMVFPKHHER